MFLGNPNTFLGNPLDRAGNERRDPTWLVAQRNRGDARALIADPDEGTVLLNRGEGRSFIKWLPLQDLPSEADPDELVLLGLDEGAPRYAAPVPDLPMPEKMSSLRKAAPYLLREEAAIAGQALWLLSWHARHRHCARDGGETVIVDGGMKRINPQTGAEHFPRTDPVAIVVPIHEGAICLGRGPQFPQTIVSAFAGFVEPCETLEECAARELKEEAGLDARHVEYVFSQPWPFPSSLMVGFLAEVTSRTLTLDPKEIADARWFSREEVGALLEGRHPDGLMIPPPMAIAHQLLKVWLAR